MFGGFTIVKQASKQILSGVPLHEYSYLLFSICIILTLGYLFAALCTWIRKKWLKSATYAFVFVFGAVSIFLKRVLDMYISPTVFVLMAETNANESGEFMKAYMLSGKAFVTFTFIFAIFAFAMCLEWYSGNKHSKRLKQRNSSGYILPIIILMVCYSAAYSLTTSYHTMLQTHNTDDFNSWAQEHNNLRDPINRSILSLYGLHVMGLEQEQFMKTMKALGSDAAELESDEPLNVVVVIGESYIKQHAQIYGYQLQTTPNMKREEVNGNLFAFQNVVSPTPSTSFTIKNVLCINSISNSENWADTPYFPTLFRKAGYDVYLWDNQRSMEPDAVYTFALNSFLYGKEISEMTYTKTNDKG